MSRFSPINLGDYPIPEVLEALDFEAYLARDREAFRTRWQARRAATPELPDVDALLLDSDPASVILQVGSFKLTGQRVFKMAPIHHHFELIGWSEPKVITRFLILAVIFALFSLTTLKLR